MAAVLYAANHEDYEDEADDDFDDEYDDEYYDEDDDWQEDLTALKALLEKADRKDLEKMLLGIADNDKKIGNAIYAFLQPEEILKPHHVQQSAKDGGACWTDWRRG